MKLNRLHPYLGFADGAYSVCRFSSQAVADREMVGTFSHLIGPFRTVRAACFMRDTRPNPHCRTVADAERLAKLHNWPVSRDAL